MIEKMTYNSKSLETNKLQTLIRKNTNGLKDLDQPSQIMSRKRTMTRCASVNEKLHH